LELPENLDQKNELSKEILTIAYYLRTARLPRDLSFSFPANAQILKAPTGRFFLKINWWVL
jgi:hypothetical protein